MFKRLMVLMFAFMSLGIVEAGGGGASTIYVRINRKSGQEKFHRCGMAFTREWLPVIGADVATVKRLKEEQMLEVSETRPDDYVEPTNTPQVGEGVSDEAARLAAIKDAIGKLDVDNAALWTKGGMPQTVAIEEITGFPVSADERNAAWAEIQAAQ